MLGLPTQLISGALRVLVADHKKDLAVSTTLLIRQCGHSARAVFDSFAALEVAGDYRPNIILIDHGLGSVISSYEVAKRLRRRPDWKPALVLALAENGEGDRDDAAFDLW